MCVQELEQTKANTARLTQDTAQLRSDNRALSNELAQLREEQEQVGVGGREGGVRLAWAWLGYEDRRDEDRMEWHACCCVGRARYCAEGAEPEAAVHVVRGCWPWLRLKLGAAQPC